MNIYLQFQSVSLPVPNSKCVSVLGQYKCNSWSLLNHRLIHVTFLTCQTCVQSDFTMVRLGQSVKIKLSTGIEPTISSSVLVGHLSCATLTLFAAAKIRLKEANFKRESEQNIKHGRLAFIIAQHWFTLWVRYGYTFFAFNN